MKNTFYNRVSGGSHRRMMSLVIIYLILLPSVVLADEVPPVTMGELLPDTDGNHINAHGGNILVSDSLYYWYGEFRGDGTPGSFQQGVACYSSANLRDWKYRGIVLKVTDDDSSPVQKGCIIERPKVVYCPATGRYVLWFHNELKGRGYGAAYAGVATSASPLGPFELKYSGRVNAGIAPLNMSADDLSATYPENLEWWTPEWYDAVRRGMFVKRDIAGGQMSRDMTVYIDPESGKGYHIYSSEDNLTLHIAELDSTYERHNGRYIRIFPGGHNEAPAIFRHGGKYWMITSGCTGWQPNEARLMSADSIMGEWKQHPSPCRGDGAETTFGGQGTFVLQLNDGCIFMADIWNPDNLADSRHIWLPISFDENDMPYIESYKK